MNDSDAFMSKGTLRAVEKKRDRRAYGGGALGSLNLEAGTRLRQSEMQRTSLEEKAQVRSNVRWVWGMTSRGWFLGITALKRRERLQVVPHLFIVFSAI